MKTIVVAGTGSGCGKTTVACRILRAIPGLGAVKISPCNGASRVEWGPGEPGKDTDLYAGSGAARVARIIGPRELVGAAWESMKVNFEGCRGVVFEGGSALNVPGERIIVFVVDNPRNGQEEQRNREIAEKADLIIDRSSHLGGDSFIRVIRRFLDDSADE